MLDNLVARDNLWRSTQQKVEQREFFGRQANGTARARHSASMAVEFVVDELLLGGEEFAEAHPFSGLNGSA